MYFFFFCGYNICILIILDNLINKIIGVINFNVKIEGLKLFL